MPVLVARTGVHRPPEVVFDALADLRRYESYSDHLAGVTRTGDGDAGTEYTLRFEWWLVSYTVRSAVTGFERPERIDFAVTDGISAEGAWVLEPIAVDGPGSEGGTRVTFTVAYDPDTVDESALGLPALASVSWVIDRVAPLVEREAEGVVQRVVRDLESSQREVDLEVTVR